MAVRTNYYQEHLKSDGYLRSRTDKALLLMDILDAVVPRWARAADLGSGSGIIKTMMERRWGRPVLGIEVDPGCIVDRGNTCVGDVAALPLRGGSTDLLICNHLFEHVPDQSACLRELRRVLSDGGTVYFTMCNKYKLVEPHYRLPFLSWLPKPMANAYLRLSGRGADYSDINFRSFRQLARMTGDAGLAIRDITWDVIAMRRGDSTGLAQRVAASSLRLLPERLRRALVQRLTPQWFLLLTLAAGR